jgi:hypothetical protein
MIFEAIFPYFYFLLFPIYECFEKFKYVGHISFWVVTVLLTIICFLIISKFALFNNKRKSIIVSYISFCFLVAFLAFVIPNHSNFPFQTLEDQDVEVSKELASFFKDKYKFKKAKNYNKIESEILKYYSEKQNSIKNQYELSKYFKTYSIENIDKISVIVDTIVFNQNAEYFMATILIKHDDIYSQSSVIGKNQKQIIISQNDCFENVSGSDLKGMKLNVRKFYFVDYNKNETCFKFYGKYNPSDEKYWRKIKDILK